MTIPNTTRKAGPLLGTGSQTAWPFTFKVFAAGDIQVTIANSSGVETLLVLGTDYSVSLNANQETSPGGTVTYPLSGSALPVGSVLAIIGDLDYDQPLDLPSGGNFSPTALENQLDRSTMQIQQLREEMNRTAKLPPTSLESVEELVDDLQRIADSADNLDTVANNIADVNTVAADLNEPVSEINTVAGAIANVNAVGNNITNVNTVAGISANVTTVAGIAANVTTVAGIAANVTAVAGNATNINAVAGNATNINAVAANETNIDAVAANEAAIDIVAGISAAVSAVAAIDDDVSTVAANVADVTNFADVYQGAKASDPTLRNNGDALQAGDLYFNTTDNALRAYSGSQWVAGTAGTVNVQRFSGDGSDTTFTLASAPAGENNTQVYIGGVYQQKDQYSLSGSTLTFASAPPSGTDNIEVVTIATLALGETDASLVSFLASGAGAVEMTAQTKMRQVVHVDDYAGSIAAAVNALPAAGGIVMFAAGTYVSPYGTGSPLTKDNITFQGAGRPDFNSGYTGLEGGTIIQGTFNWKSNNCSWRALGIDVGSAVCTTLNGGTAMEGLVSGSGTFDLYYHNNHIENVSVICKDASATVHAILFESQEEGSIRNVATVYAAAGVVLKARRVNVDGVYARSHGNYDFLIKSDRPGGTCDEINVTNLLLETAGNPTGMVPGNGANWDSNGLVLLPTATDGVDYPVTNVNITNVISRNVKSGINFDTTSGGYVKNVNISNFVVENCFFAGVSVEINSSRCTFSDGVVTKTDYGVLNDGNEMRFDNVSSIQSGHHCFASSGTDVVFNNCTADTPYSIGYRGFDITAGSAVIRTANYRNITTNKYAASGGATVSVEDVSALNTTSQDILDYLRRGLIEEIESISGAGSVVAAYFNNPVPSSTTMVDWSSYATNVATYRVGSTLAATATTGIAKGLGSYVTLDANRVWDTPDANDLSFGNGTTDSPFSVMCLCKPIVSFLGYPAAKLDATTGAEKREWGFLLASSSGLFMTLYDNSTGGTLSRRFSGTLSPYNGIWNTYTGTYDGSRTAAGIKVYIGDTDLTNSDISAGTYVAMENTAAKVGSYQLSTAGAVQYPLYADMAVTLIFKVNLSAANIAAIRKKLNKYFSL